MLELMHKGGPIMWFIFAASFLGVEVFLAKLYDLHRAQIRSSDFLKGIYNILNRHNIVEAVSICEETPGPVASIVRAAILCHDEERPVIAQAIEEAGLAEVPRLERNLTVLATLAQITPMLGLLGTVLGMIRVLLVIEQKAPLVHAGDVLGGLWQALLTAAAGLAVAIPAYAGYNFLVSRVEAIVLDMERAAVDILAYLTGPTRRPGA
ncbi:MAG: MotA/TolQ/ExbB proton channel family protein [Verrucomicrobia bacterium]|nr:MotA/TolQ/ExbB proton channel family protein [Verrucomicrobiota bacterium]MBU1909188.1 MotA/TolQ/ExbB proton channel family protein [Verrucomicrobiota bacterium]